MYKGTEIKIEAVSSQLWEIHKERKKYERIVHLLDEPYRLTLEIMALPTYMSDEEIAHELEVNRQTVKRIRKIIGH